MCRNIIGLSHSFLMLLVIISDRDVRNSTDDMMGKKAEIFVRSDKQSTQTHTEGLPSSNGRWSLLRLSSLGPCLPALIVTVTLLRSVQMGSTRFTIPEVGLKLKLSKIPLGPCQRTPGIKFSWILKIPHPFCWNFSSTSIYTKRFWFVNPSYLMNE